MYADGACAIEVAPAEVMVTGGFGQPQSIYVQGEGYKSGNTGLKILSKHQMHILPYVLYYR